ncbi:asparaginase domain-containing protein [Maribacter sp. 2210JD10-5]|uniref:asparaginase domain-containing protein n=1 Tax=Maribacter sp. 2210JD10-5 TaxID=3386272 RepID=UPI0039BC48B3
MIYIITTGGTIGGLDYQNPNEKPKHEPSVVEHILKAANVSFNYEISSLFKKDSRFIIVKDRNLLSEKIKSSSTDKILITHGTITMVETAKFLAQEHLGKTIILTGAFISGTNVRSDAPFNLGFAISIIGRLSAGVYIAMNGKIFDWDNVRKNPQNKRFETLPRKS